MRSNKAVRYSCSPEGAITFDSGKLYGQKAGTATITVSAMDGSGVYATKQINVKESKESYVGVTGLQWDEIQEFTLRIGGDEKDKTHQCVVTALPENASNPMINWKSGDTGIATVENGLVTAVGKGTTYIIATSDDNASCSRSYFVTVKRAVTGITWENESSGSITMNRGDSKQLNAVVSPADADNTRINWKSDDKKVVTVDDFGNVYAVGAGTTTVWAVSDDNPNISIGMVITVKVPVEAVKVSTDEVELTAGGTATVKAWVLPEDTTENKTIIWESKDPGIATVEDGVITAVKAGTTTILAKNSASGKHAEINVTVNKAIVSLAGAVITLERESVPFNGQAQPPRIKKVMLGGVEIAAQNDEVSADDYVDVKEYNVIITGKGDYTGTASVKYSITKPKVIVTAGTAKLTNRAYDGTAYMKTEGNLEITGVPAGNRLRVTALPETVEVENKNAGEKVYVLKLKLEGEDADNAELATESIELKGVITKRGVTLANMKFKTKYYDGSKYMVLTSTKGVITGGVLDGDEVAFETKQNNYVITGTKNAGEKRRKLTRGLWNVTGKDAANYQVAAGPVATGSIKKITVKTVTLKNTAVRYTGKAQKPVISKIVGDNGSKVLLKNCKVQYYRNGKTTTDFKSKGVITVKVTGVGSADATIGRNWTGAVSVKYTIK